MLHVHLNQKQWKRLASFLRSELKSSSEEVIETSSTIIYLQLFPLIQYAVWFWLQWAHLHSSVGFSMLLVSTRPQEKPHMVGIME